jgi:AhpD family alkylhydroperoxidase
MENRLNAIEIGKDAMKTLYNIGAYLSKSTLEGILRELVNVRVSQMNGCAFCIDMHYKAARAKGETEQRLYGLVTWRHVPWYTDREKAALALAEAITRCDVPDAVFDEAKKHFSDKEVVDLTLAITTINTWNRFNTTFNSFPE